MENVEWQRLRPEWYEFHGLESFINFFSLLTFTTCHRKKVKKLRVNGRDSMRSGESCSHAFNSLLAVAFTKWFRCHLSLFSPFSVKTTWFNSPLVPLRLFWRYGTTLSLSLSIPVHRRLDFDKMSHFNSLK